MDIHGTQPNCVKFQTKRGGGNPLNPEYNLQSVEVRPITPPKFVRDNINNGDIEGSKPKKAVYYDTRNILGTDDIPGTKSRPLHVPRSNAASYNNMDYSDITHANFQTKRSANPLQPEY